MNDNPDPVDEALNAARASLARDVAHLRFQGDLVIGHHGLVSANLKSRKLFVRRKSYQRPFCVIEIPSTPQLRLGALPEALKHPALRGWADLEGMDDLTSVLWAFVNIDSSSVSNTVKIHTTSAGVAISGTAGPSDAILAALSSPAGQGVINELTDEGPYCEGLFLDRPNPRIRTWFICPYCRAEVLQYEYAEFGLCFLVCKEVGFFIRLPIDSLFVSKNWLHIVRRPARAWTEVAANEKGGHDGGAN